MIFSKGALRCCAILAACLPMVSVAEAQSPAFYKGKTITIIVGFSPGGGYDLSARTISRYIGKYIPGNPTVVVQNMPGAGSLTAINYLSNISLKDGTSLGTFSRGIAFEPLLGNKSAQFDPRKLNWIGSPSRETNVVFVRQQAPIKVFDDLKTKEMVVATTGAGADTATFPRIVNTIFDTKLKIVTGYPGATETLLAVDRGEADGMAGLSWGYLKASRPAWIKQQQVRILMQLGLTKAPDLPDVPSSLDLVTDDSSRQLLQFFLARLEIAWPLAAPPNVPSERIEILRSAFQQTMKDPEFIAEAEKQSIDVSPVSGDEIANILSKVYATDPAIVERARQISDAAR
ncbi:tripartite-type tricarboxylate transporter receptor subunit TctC [Beijerinckia sp. GAS462]|nr:tripartite-type tricarboxylate transporter receptor subunit TctC [Beijerinckia sp. GAS462]SEB78161.1 Tripartite-type tricarboxylate transporter, receptor component TctC [Beijerinckia sp. 28-YEA-48]